MKKMMFIFILVMVLLLTGCISFKEPIYITDIFIVVQEETVVGKLVFYDGENWVDYDSKNKDHTKVYYSFDLSIDQAFTIIFNTYSPDKEINEMSLTISDNLNYQTNIGEWAIIGERNKDVIQSSFYIEEPTSNMNVITIYGWLTSDGPKYVGSKISGTNYSIIGARLNYT